MTCSTCGATEGDFATRTRCMNCQRALWRTKHADRIADAEGAERRRANLADYWQQRKDAGLTHPETINRGARPEPPGARLRPGVGGP